MGKGDFFVGCNFENWGFRIQKLLAVFFDLSKMLVMAGNCLKCRIVMLRINLFACHSNQAKCTVCHGSKPFATAGFTIVELLVVIAVLAILAALAQPVYSQYITRARNARAIAELHEIQGSITAYFQENSEYPDSLADLGQIGLITDPWGHSYQYLQIEGSSIKGKGSLRKDRFLNPLNSDYDLYSMGADGLSQKPLTASQSRDDIVRANNGGFIGLASDF